MHIQRIDSATKGISDMQQKHCGRIATTRARVEHVFDSPAQKVRKLVRCIVFVRVIFALHLKSASYELKRLVFLKDGWISAVA